MTSLDKYNRFLARWDRMSRLVDRFLRTGELDSARLRGIAADVD
jgi:hypothetical protein